MASPARFIHSPDLGLLLLRLIMGAVGFYHGSQKLFGAFDGVGVAKFAEALGKMNVPFPYLSAVLAGGAELVGGLLMAVGLCTRIGAAFFAFTMGVAITLAHPDHFGADKNGMEYPLTLGVICLALVLSGAGRFSADRYFFGQTGGK